MDACLLQALRTRIRERDVPMPASTLWASHLLPSRPAGAHVDAKRSSHKKVPRFFAAKAAEGLLSVREDKHSGELLVTGVNRRHPALLAHAPHETADADDAEAGAGEPPAPGAPPPPPAPLRIEELVLPSAATRPLWDAVAAPRDAPLTAQEATTVLWSYVALHCGGAAAGGRAAVLLDPLLCDALFKGVIKKGSGESFPTELSRAELPALFLARCTHVRRVSRGDAAAAAAAPLVRGALQPLALSVASRAGGKKVTVLRGQEAYLVDADALATQLRSRFAAACAINELPRPEANASSRAPPLRELVLQGDRAPQVAALLEETWGVPRRCIAVPAAAKAKK